MSEKGEYMSVASPCRPRTGSGAIRRRLAALAMLFGVLAGPGLPSAAAADAGAWPQSGRTVRLVVGYSPGGGTDVLARLVAERLSTGLGIPFVVENHAGAGGTIAANIVSKARPDGYTLLFASDPELAIAPVVLDTMQYDPLSDLQPVSQVARGPYVIVARPSFPAKTLAELVAYAKAHPGQANFGSSGTGTSSHLLGEQLAMLAGVKVTHVPYKGLSAVVSDLVAGHIDYAFVPPLVARSFIEAGSLRPIAMATTERLAGMSSIPTTVEEGYPDVVGGSWYALLGPAGMDPRINAALQQGVREVLADKESRMAIERLALIPQGGGPEKLRQLMQDDSGKWRRLVGQLAK